MSSMDAGIFTPPTLSLPPSKPPSNHVPVSKPKGTTIDSQNKFFPGAEGLTRPNRGSIYPDIYCVIPPGDKKNCRDPYSADHNILRGQPPTPTPPPIRLTPPPSTQPQIRLAPPPPPTHSSPNPPTNGLWDLGVPSS
jgi:hypothetical protein